MKVKALKNILYSGEIYNAGDIFDIDEISFAIAKKYGNVEPVEGAAEIEIETAEVVELPPLEVKKKK